MQLETQCYRGYTRTGTLSQETAVECRFGGEVETVLSAHAELLPVQATAEEGGVRVLGRARFSLLVYENAEHGVCRVEKGAEFTLKAQGECHAAALPRVRLKTENISVRREGGERLSFRPRRSRSGALRGGGNLSMWTGGGLVTKTGRAALLFGASLLGRDGDGRRIRDGLFWATSCSIPLRRS